MKEIKWVQSKIRWNKKNEKRFRPLPKILQSLLGRHQWGSHLSPSVKSRWGYFLLGLKEDPVEKKDLLSIPFFHFSHHRRCFRITATRWSKEQKENNNNVFAFLWAVAFFYLVTVRNFFFFGPVFSIYVRHVGKYTCFRPIPIRKWSLLKTGMGGCKEIKKRKKKTSWKTKRR